MISIRRYLITWLSVGVLGTTLLVGAIIFFSAKHEVDELYDAHLKQIARTLSSQIEHDNLHENPPKNWVNDSTRHHITREEDYLIQLWHQEPGQPSELVYSAYPAIVFPLQEPDKIRTTTVNGTRWRSFSTQLKDGWIQVAQPSHTRSNMLLEVLQNIMFPLIFQLPFLAWLIWFTVRRSLRSLGALSHAIGQREPDALAPLDMHAIPEEVQDLVLALNHLLQRLSTALQTQRRFTADAAHELRTPLTALQLQLDILRRAPSAEERKAAIGRLAAGIERGIRLVTQLLTMTRMEPSSPPASMQPVRLDSLARQSLELHVTQSIAKNIDLGLSVAEPLTVLGHEEGLLTLLNNLLSNAINYTPANGQVDIIIAQQATGPSIAVQDNGNGIPAEDQSRVFDRFYRVLGNRVQGTGLGLAIVKAIADEHDATIQLESNANGTRITVFFKKFSPAQS